MKNQIDGENSPSKVSTQDSSNNSSPSKEIEISDEEANYKFSVLGFSLGMLAHCLFSVCQPIVKVLYEHNRNISEYEIIYFKSISMMVFNTMYIRWHGITPLDVIPKFRKVIVFRALIGFWGLAGPWSAIKYLPVSIAISIFMMLPIFTAILARIVLKEQITKYDILSIICSFSGVIMINDPFGISAGEATDEAAADETQHNYLIGTLYCMVGCIGASCAFTCMRYMKDGIHASISPFWFAIGCTFLSPLMYSFTQDKSDSKNVAEREYLTTSYDAYTIGLMTVESIFTFFYQILLSRAYQLEKAAVITPIIYIQFVVAILFDIIFQKTVLKTNEIIGSILIVGVLFSVAIFKTFGIIK